MDDDDDDDDDVDDDDYGCDDDDKEVKAYASIAVLCEQETCVIYVKATLVSNKHCSYTKIRKMTESM